MSQNNQITFQVTVDSKSGVASLGQMTKEVDSFSVGVSNAITKLADMHGAGMAIKDGSKILLSGYEKTTKAIGGMAGASTLLGTILKSNAARFAGYGAVVAASVAATVKAYQEYNSMVEAQEALNKSQAAGIALQKSLSKGTYEAALAKAEEGRVVSNLDALIEQKLITEAQAEELKQVAQQNAQIEFKRIMDERRGYINDETEAQEGLNEVKANEPSYVLRDPFVPLLNESEPPSDKVATNANAAEQVAEVWTSTAGKIVAVERNSFAHNEQLINRRIDNENGAAEQIVRGDSSSIKKRIKNSDMYYRTTKKQNDKWRNDTFAIAA